MGKISKILKTTVFGLFIITNSLWAQQDSISKQTRWTLKSCIDYALKNNITIQKNKINLQNTYIDRKTTNAAFLPGVSFSTDQTLTNRPFQSTASTVNGTQVISTTNKNSYTGSYGLSASMTIYNGGILQKNIELQKLNTNIADLTVRTSEKTIEESITKIYIEILYATETIRIDQIALELSNTEFKRSQELQKAGTLNKADVALLQSQVSTDHYQLVTDQATLSNYKLQLKQLLELTNNYEMNLFLPQLDDKNVLQPLPDKNEVFTVALSTRPEIESKQVSIKLSDLNIHIAKAAYLPTISLNAQVNTYNMNNDDYAFAKQLKKSWSNTIGLSVSIPIYDKRQTKSAIEKAILAKQSSILDLQDQQKTLYKTIEDLWLDANSAQQRYIAAQEKYKSSQISFNLIQEQFNSGLKNIIELLTQKTTLDTSLQQLLQAKYMAILNTQLLNYYQGNKINL